MSQFKNLVLRAALETALKSCMATQYSCIITLRGKILATGFNYSTCHTTLKTQCILRG